MDDYAARMLVEIENTIHSKKLHHVPGYDRILTLMLKTDIVSYGQQCFTLYSNEYGTMNNSVVRFYTE